MQSHMMARNIKLENIWLFLSTLSLGNSSTSKNNNTKWIREELHVFFTPSSRGSFKRCISRSPPTNVARGFESWHWRHMWVEFVVGFLPCSETFFSGYFDSVSPLLKNQHFQFQFDLERADTFPRVLKKYKVLLGSMRFMLQERSVQLRYPLEIDLPSG